VTMTLDAFPNETFTGSVFYIAPAQTDTQGVISYTVKISFAKADPRLKSGLTANIDIETMKKDAVLVLPQYAILQNDSGTFVETLVGGVATTTPVSLGIQDQSGNVEVLSGVTEGEQVINIGLKTQ
jgi:multidrug efflux pump subunit AcrA (membrane-fusion protein)